MSKKNKKNDLQNMVEYTYRDIGQEYLMKRKVVRSVILAIITMVALAVFIALYLDEKKKVQQTYQKQYELTLKTVLDDIESYKNADGDLDFRYRRLTADMNTAASFLFLLDEHEEEKKAIQGLYTVLLRYPKQGAERLDNIKEAIEHVLDGVDKGYEEVLAIVDGVNKKGQ